MNNVKMCERCNAAIISNLHEASADYYRHLSVKYCDACRKIVRTEQNRASLKRYRARQKAGKTAKQEREMYLKAENDMLRRNYSQLCDAVAILRRELEQIKAECDRI